MIKMKKIITLGGSSSKNSINKQMAEFTGGLINNVELIKIDLNDFEMPLYSIDKETDKGFSDTTQQLNAIFESADGFVVSLAEHNGAYTAVFKNVYDWLSRMESNVWRDKPMLLLSTSPGGRGGQTVLDIAIEKFPRMGANIISSMSFPSFYENFNNGELVNEDFKTELEKKVKLFEKKI